MQHTTSHTTAVQLPSPDQRCIPIGEQWYQLPEFIPSNSNSGLHSCISISIHTQHVITQIAKLIHYLQLCTGTNIHTCVCILCWLLGLSNLYKQMTSSLYACYPLYHCTSCVQLVHCIELLPTPLPHTTHGHLAAFCLNFWCSSLVITFVLLRLIYHHAFFPHYFSTHWAFSLVHILFQLSQPSHPHTTVPMVKPL